MSEFSLQRQLLGALQAGGAECRDLAARFGVSWEATDRALQALAAADLVDAHDPPPPCSRREMRWFVLPAGQVIMDAPQSVQVLLFEVRDALHRLFPHLRKDARQPNPMRCAAHG